MLVAGDTGTMVSKAVLTAGNPEGDVMFGVDNTFLSRVVDADVFEPYEAAGLDAVPAELRALVPDGEATPVDFGDVCVNYDMAWFEEHGLEPPADLDGARRSGVRRPARRREPGDVVARAGVPAGDDRRVRRGRLGATTGRASRDNGVEVVDGWTEAYYERFCGAGDGDRAARRQLRHEPAGRGRLRRPADRRGDDRRDRHARASARSSSPACCAAPSTPTRPAQLVDFLLAERFQAELPLNLFVYPANADVAAARRCSPTTPRVPADPATLDPATITANREAWIDEWTDIVLR